MQTDKIELLLAQMGYPDKTISVKAFQREEDGEDYEAWHIQTRDQEFVLKKAKGRELDIYQTFFPAPCTYAPSLLGSVRADDADYFLMEFISGTDLCSCDREQLTMVLDSLIAMQETYWNFPSDEDIYEKSLKGRQDRGNYLNDPQLEAVYSAFMRKYTTVSRTLCHDDLLPFNVICNKSRAVFIDWECGGILPYPVSLARFLAHGEEEKDAFFSMKSEDKSFAIDYYYAHFIQRKGINREDFLRSFELFCFYEYCEWVFLGNKYGNTDTPRFQKYLKKAKESAQKLGF